MASQVCLVCFLLAGAMTEMVLLGSVAYHADERFTWNAAKLTAMNSPKAQEYLRRFMSRPLCRQCQESFSERFLDHREESEAGVLECMRSQDPTTLDKAYRMLHLMRRKAELPPEICTEIVRAANDPDPWTRRVVLDCVKLLPTAQSQPILTAWLHSGDPKLKFYAIDGLAKPGAFELTEFILPWLRDKDQRYVALQFLVRIRDPATIEAVRMYANDPQSHVRDEVSRFFRVMSSALGREIEP